MVREIGVAPAFFSPKLTNPEVSPESTYWPGGSGRLKEPIPIICTVTRAACRPRKTALSARAEVARADSVD